MEKLDVNIDELYELYKRNIIRAVSALSAVEKSPFEISGQAETLPFLYNVWTRSEKEFQWLKDSLKDNGTYFMYLLKPGDRMLAGSHRLTAMQELDKEGYKKNMICIQCYDISAADFDPFIVESYTRSKTALVPNGKSLCYNYISIIDNLVLIGNFLADALYMYKIQNEKEYPASLLCNNYDCLMGAVAHYKETGEFIIDNDELTRLFINKNANI